MGPARRMVVSATSQKLLDPSRPSTPEALWRRTTPSSVSVKSRAVARSASAWSRIPVPLSSSDWCTEGSRAL